MRSLDHNDAVKTIRSLPDDDEIKRIMDRMVLYKILDSRYELTPTFVNHLEDTIRVIEESPEHEKIYDSMSDFEFTMIIVVPRYLAKVRAIKKKLASSSDYLPEEKLTKIAMTWNEISEESDKLTFEEMSDEQWSELRLMSTLIYSYLSTCGEEYYVNGRI